MLPAPRIIAIDDEPEHLEGLTRGLNRYGTACLPIHFTGEAEAIRSCPHVRVIFADLHLSGGAPGEHARDFATIGGLLEDTIKPSGPYFIVLWTMYPDQADHLHEFLKKRLQGVASPFAVRPLDKSDHLDPRGCVKSVEALVDSIRRIVAEQAQIGALLNWEERVLGAAADAVSSIMDLADSAGEDVGLGPQVGRLLTNFAVAAVGERRAGDDWFRAVNESLLPILADSIASLRSRDVDDELWQDALGEAGAPPKLSLCEASMLNRLLHIEPSIQDDSGAERGSVIELPKEFSGDAFRTAFDLSPEEAAQKQFWRKSAEQDDDTPLEWVLVQTQAACDYAQQQPGPLPFNLGLHLPASRVRRDTPPAALWRSPCFELHGEAAHLHVNGRFQISMPRGKAQRERPLLRLREALLNDLIYHLHGYGARPGIISFRSPK